MCTGAVCRRTTEGAASSGVCVYDSLREGVVWEWLVGICVVHDGSFPKRRVHGFGPWWALNRRPRRSADVNSTYRHFVNKLLDGRRRRGLASSLRVQSRWCLGRGRGASSSQVSNDAVFFNIRLGCLVCGIVQYGVWCVDTCSIRVVFVLRRGGVRPNVDLRQQFTWDAAVNTSLSMS